MLGDAILVAILGFKRIRHICEKRILLPLLGKPHFKGPRLFLLHIVRDTATVHFTEKLVAEAHTKDRDTLCERVGDDEFGARKYHRSHEPHWISRRAAAMEVEIG